MKTKIKFNSIDEVNNHANQFVNQPFKNFLDTQKLNQKNKGGLGNLIQTDLFGIPVNNNKAADFLYYGLDLELKVTPLRKIQSKENRWSSKERLVMGMIDYAQIVEEENFYSSHLFTKTKQMQIITYVDNPSTQIEDWEFASAYLLDLKKLPENELKTIEEDYQIIRNKVLMGKAHEISESDTSILAACTKGSTREKSFRKQPFSEEKAKSRTFSLKPSYMTSLFYRNLHPEDYLQTSHQETGSIYITNLLKYINNNLIDQNVHDYYTKVMGKTKVAKQMNNMVINEMLKKYDSDYKNTLNKFGYKIRTMTINEKNKFQESFPLSNSLDNFDMQDPNYTFEKSEVYQQLVLTKYIIIPVQKIQRNLKNNFICQPIEFFIDENNQELISKLRKVWEETKECYIQPETKIKKIETDENNNNYYVIQFPTAKDGLEFHIRPKAKDKKDRYLIGHGQLSIVKQTFWINKAILNKYYSKKQ